MDSHKTKSKVIFALVMAISMLLYLVSPILPNNVIAVENNEDKLVRLDHTNSVNTDPLEFCLRTIEGEISFTRPLVQKYIDLVIVQDASGSFANTIGTMKDGLKAVVDKLNAANGDRVMVTTYQMGNRYQWYKTVNGNQVKDGGVQTGSGSSWGPVSVQTRYALGNNFPSAKTAINGITANGATPTARGLQYALNEYNMKRSSLGDTGDLLRETVFLLVTDGVANVRLPDGSSGDNGTIWLDRNWGGSNRTGFDEKYQDYKTAIDQAGTIANQIKGQGYYMISTFIQDLSSLRSQYGQSYYDGTVGPYTQAALKAMATSNNYYVVFNNPTSFGNTVGNLFDALVEEISQEWIEVNIEPGYQVVESKLYKNSTLINDNLGLDTGLNNVSVTQDGDYRITYKLKELEFFGSEETPVTATGRSGQKRYEIDNPTVPGNPNTVCLIEPTEPVKKVNGQNHVDLSHVRDEVTYTVTTYVKNIFNMTNFGFEDEVDDLLKITPGSVDVKVDGTSIVKAGELTVVGNKIKFLKQSDFHEIEEKEVVLEFKASIDACVLCGEVKNVYPDSKIPNTATLLYNHKRVESNTVTIKPPAPEVPQISKDVNGKTHENLTAMDDEFTYRVKVLLPQQPEGELYEKLIIQDTLESVLDITGYRALLDNVEDPALTGLITQSGQTVTLSFNDTQVDFTELIGKVIALEIKAKIKDGADLSGYAEDKIPNEGSYSFNDNDFVTSNKVTVTPPPDIPEIDKEVNGKTHENLVNKNDIFTYQVNVDIPSRVHGYDSLVIRDTLENVLDIVSVKVLLDGTEDASLSAQAMTTGQMVSLTLDSTFDFSSIVGKKLTLEIKANIKAGANLDLYVNDTVPNQATLVFNDQYDVLSNIVTVTPPTSDPVIEKDVNGKTHEDLTQRDEVFTYHVEVTLPNNLSGYESFMISDTLEAVLEEKGVTVWVNGVEDLALKARVDITGQTISLTLNESEMGQFARKTITLVIKAQIRDGADLSGYENETIPNKGSYQINDRPKTQSNEVTVTPPVEDPGIKKEINGQNHVDLEERDESFIYTVHVDVPHNIRGYESLLISDTLENVLQILDVKVQVNGVEDEDLGDLVDIDDWKVSLRIGEDGMSDVAGKRVTLVIQAKIKNGADLGEYMDDTVPNKAIVKVNDNPGIESNVVTVTPPVEEPEIEKDVNGKLHEDLAARNQVFTYHVSVGVPENVRGYEELVIRDTLEAVLEIQDVRVLQNGVQNAILTSYLTVVGQEVKLVLDDTFDFDSIAGATITLDIEAKIKEDADLSEYDNETIPNKGTVELNDDPAVDSNTVTVTPPVEEPEVEKDVNGKTHEDLVNKHDVFSYHVSVEIPENVRGYEELVIRDMIESVLQVEDVKVLKNGVQDAVLTSYLTVVGQEVKLVLGDTFDFDSIAGATITLVIEAKIKEDADLSEYVADTVPNTASVKLNDDPAVDSNVVTVTPPIEDSDIRKDVNGKLHEDLAHKNDVFTYHVNVKIPDNVRGYESLLIGDVLVPVLEIKDVKVLLDGVEDPTLLSYATVLGQQVELMLSGEFDFGEIKGKVLSLVIEAKIRSGANLSEYEGSRVPNEGYYVLNDGPVNESNIVTVKPPADPPPPPPPPPIEDPGIEKTVNGKLHEDLEEEDEPFVYRVHVDIPDNVQDYESLVIVDQLEDVLAIREVKVLLEGVEDVALTSLVEAHDHLVKLSLDETFDFTRIAGRRLTIVIEVNIAHGADLDDHVDWIIPNKATITLNDRPTIESNVVTVKVPDELVLGEEEELPSTGGYLDKTVLWGVGAILMLTGAALLVLPRFKKEH